MKTSHLTCFAVLLFCLMSFCINAQTLISGKVTFKKAGQKDVSVTLADSYDGATTDADGHFSFQTEEKGEHKLIFSNPKFVSVEKSVLLDGSPLVLTLDLKEQISEIAAVVISAGSIEASDQKRATALLSPIDILTTAGANGQVTAALETLTGVQKVGETEGLFVRGGTGAETRFYMDGNLVNNFFGNSVPGVKAMDRLNTSLFKGNVFSSGGYSAVYGQALSSVLLLESIDFPERNSVDLGISPIFINGGFQNVNAQKTKSFGIAANYFNLGLMTKLLKFNTDFSPAPTSFGTNFNFRWKNTAGGMLKYYGSFDTNKLGLSTPSLEPATDTDETALKGNNTFHSVSYRQKLGLYTLNLGSSYTYNSNDISLHSLFNSATINPNEVDITGNYFNAKAVLDRKINRISAIRGGVEYNGTRENTSVALAPAPYHFTDDITAVFAETDSGLSNNFSAKLGLRGEYSDALSKWNLAPRAAVAYRLAKGLTTSFAYGVFYQNPENRYFGEKPLHFQRADHYILQVQKSTAGRTLRAEVFYKKYEDLIKNQILNYRPVAVNNNGSGYAKGLEIFWRDKTSLPNIDYWVSYSYLDSEREFQNYDRPLFPGFAAKHTLSAVAKKFVTKWKTGFNASYTLASGRPYYNFTTTSEGQYHLSSAGTLPGYGSLNFSLNYLPNLGKKDAKAFTVLVLAINNVLNQKNIYGYQFSNDGLRNRPLLPVSNTFIFVGAFISFGIDRTQDAINNNL